MFKRKRGGGGDKSVGDRDDDVHVDDVENHSEGKRHAKQRCKTLVAKVRQWGWKSVLQWICLGTLGLLVLVFLLDPRLLLKQVKRAKGARKVSSSSSSSSSGSGSGGIGGWSKLIPLRESWTLDQYAEDVVKLRAGNFSLMEAKKQRVQKKLVVTIPKPYKLHHRSFGCMRDTCRGLEIEDLFDRGFHRYFRSALTNVSAQTYNLKSNYHVTVLLLDTTQLNHMKSSVPQLFKKVWETQASSTYVIAFEGGDAMGGNKGFQLRQKDRFTRNFGCDYDSLAVQPIQYRLYVKSECESLLDRSKRDKTTSFLLKPEAGSQGQGITFHPNAEEIVEKRPEFFPCETRHGIQATSRFLVQEYIVRPLLLAKCKFDARVYLFVSSSDPYLLWYHRGYLRRSLTPYSPTTRDRKAYLTNTHFQSSRANFNMSEHIWTFDRMQKQLVMQKQAGHGWVESALEPHIKEIARFVFESAREKIIPRKGSNQIIGLDFMLDDQLALHFIEANGYPGFTWSVNFDSRGMVEDMFDLMMEQGEAPSPFRFLRSGDWFGGFQLIHSDVRLHRWPYSPCEKLVDNSLLTKVVKSANEALYSRVSLGSKDDEDKSIKSITKATSSSKPQKSEGNEDDDDEEEENLKEEQGGDSIASFVESYPALAHTINSCSQFVAETYRLSLSSSECDRFSSKYSSSSAKDETKPHTQRTVLGFSSPALVSPVLFPNVSSAMNLLRIHRDGCPVRTTSGKKWIVQILQGTELQFHTERVAYPGGRKPLPVFYRDKSLAENNQDSNSGDEKEDGAATATSEFVPRPTDRVYVRGERVLRLFGSMMVTYRMKWFLLVLTSPSPKRSTMAWTFAGYAYSMRRTRCGGSTHESLEEGEHALSLDLLQDLLSLESIASTHYVMGLMEPTIRRVAQDITKQLNNQSIPSSSSSSLLIGMDFAVDAQTLKPMLTRTHVVTNEQVDKAISHNLLPTDDDDSDGDGREELRNASPLQSLLRQDIEGVVPRRLKRLKESRDRLERTFRIAPMFFARTKRGDAFEEFRLVHSGLEGLRGEDLESSDPCGDVFPTQKDLRFAVEFERFALKRKNAMNRDLNKRIVKRWMVCRVKKTDELKLKCMRNLLSERYRIIVERNRLVSDEERWIQETVRGLIDYSRKAGPAADEEDERKFGGTGAGRKGGEDDV